ncbi:MAG: hypothetical protein Salg2KO_19460 [Salibacteraceae bacterium]
MNTTKKQWAIEVLFLLTLCLGFVAIASAQSNNNSTEPPQKKVRVEVEITENGKTSTSIQELNLDKESIHGQLDEMVEEIEMILEEAVQDVEDTDLEITIRRNSNGEVQTQQTPQYRSFISVLPEPPHPPHMEDQAFLGVYAESLDEEEIERVELDHAVRIERVVEGSSAEDNGLEVGDVIYEADGIAVEDFEVLSEAIRSHKPGEKMELKLIKDGKTVTKEIELGKREHTKVVWTDDKRAFLGVQGKDSNGALLTHIVENSAAEKAGIQVNDRVTSIDREEVDSFDDLAEIIKSHQGGDEVEITLIRNGEEERVTAKLGEKAQRYHFEGYNFDDGFSYKYNYGFNKSQDCEDMSKRAFLGVVAKNIDDKGVEITRVIDGSAAEEMGLQQGDVIRKIDGEKILDVETLVEELKGKEVGEKVIVEYSRGKKKEETSGTLSSKADHMDSHSYKVDEERVVTMNIKVEELDESEIAALSEKSGTVLDASNSLEIADLKFSPNPTSGEFSLSFNAEEAGDLNIRVFDQNGRVVTEEVIPNFTGDYSNRFDITDESSGVYFVSITQNGKGRTARLVKQ